MRTEEQIAADTKAVKATLRKTPKTKNEIASETGLDGSVVFAALKSLMNEDKAFKIGDKRGAKYSNTAE